jgi:SAM-dependent methyltransferase
VVRLLIYYADWICPTKSSGQLGEEIFMKHHSTNLIGYVMSPLDFPIMKTEELIDGSCNQILDIGTGTGIWAIDMADKYPMAMVIGIDLSPIQPSFIPNNWCITFLYSIFCRMKASKVPWKL